MKRVVALEGDTVLLDPRRRPITKDGREPAEARAWDQLKGQIKVSEGHVWVEGDNQWKTWDSNAYGPISKSLIEGRAIAVVGPLSKFWSKPWETYKSRTKVTEGKVEESWTDGLPIELAEIRDSHAPP